MPQILYAYSHQKEAFDFLSYRGPFDLPPDKLYCFDRIINVTDEINRLISIRNTIPVNGKCYLCNGDRYIDIGNRCATGNNLLLLNGNNHTQIDTLLNRGIEALKDSILVNA